MRPYLIIAAMIACAAGLFGEIRIVASTSGGKTKTTSTEVREIAEGSDLRIEELGEEGSMSSLLGEDGAVKSSEIRAKDGTILMVNDGKYVTVSGSWKGKDIGGKCDLKGRRFYGQGFEFALRALAREGLKSLKFPMIKPLDPSKATVMELTREGADTYRGGKAIKVKVALSGALAMFWSAHLLMDEEGSILRYEGNQGPGTADMVTELVEVRQ